jgi:hypothetical protein
VSSIIDYGNPVWFLHIKVRKAYNQMITIEFALIMDLVPTQIIKDLDSSGPVCVCLRRTSHALYGILSVSKQMGTESYAGKSSSCSHMFCITVCLESLLRTECHSALFAFELVCR